MVQPSTIALNDVIGSVKEQLSQQLGTKNIQLDVSLEIYEVTLRMNPDLILRVIVNLIENAIKFSFPNSKIAVRAYKKNNKFFLTVTDSGLGFEPKDKEEIFKKFTKAGKSGTSNEPSTGIGLYLCKRIVEKYHGQILAESEGFNQGAVFTVVFDIETIRK